MSSEAITRNDLTAILNEVLPPTPSEYRKLLWTNPDSSSSFEAQTISLDLSNYDAVEVVTQHWSNNGTTATMRAQKGEVGIVAVPNYDNAAIGQRSFTVSATGVQFTDGRNVSGTSISSSSYAAIPRRIYGIKYERVAPPQVDASDYVVEQGVSDIWTYRKWESGIAECWCGTSKTATAAQTEFTLYYPSGLFTSVTTVTANGSVTGNINSGVRYTATSTTYCDIWITAEVTGTATVNVHVFGRWK